MTLGGADALHGKAAGLPWRAACTERRAGHAGGLHRDDDLRTGVVRCMPKACMVVSCWPSGHALSTVDLVANEFN